MVAIAAFDDEDEALRLANATDAGLAAYLYTSDLARAMRLGGTIRAGMVGINRGRSRACRPPSAGVGHAGYGSAGGTEGIEEYLVTRYLTMPSVGGAW